MKRKYFFFDIDGTLLTKLHGENALPESTRKALELLKANGHFIAIATGRSQAMAEEVRKMLNLPNMVSDGGNGITLNHQLVEIEPLDYNKCLALVDECIEKDFIWAISFDNGTVRFAPDQRFIEATQDSYMDTQVVDGLNAKDYSTIYKMYIACPPGKEAELTTLKDLPWCRFGPKYIFVEPCDKSKGILKMLELIGGNPEDVVVFGDQRNDLSMFCDQWLCIAMATL